MIYSVAIQILLGIMYANFAEVFIHKYVLHEMGKQNKDSFFRFHWSEHHRTARRNHMVDSSYLVSFWKDSARLKEVLGLVVLATIHLPLMFLFPVFVLTIWSYTVAYYFAHKHSHLGTEWGKKYLPWHYQHHMLKNQDKNWGVLLPIADWFLGTRSKK